MSWVPAEEGGGPWFTSSYNSSPGQCPIEDEWRLIFLHHILLGLMPLFAKKLDYICIVALVEGNETNLRTFLSAEFWLYFIFGSTSV